MIRTPTEVLVANYKVYIPVTDVVADEVAVNRIIGRPESPQLATYNNFTVGAHTTVHAEPTDADIGDGGDEAVVDE